MADHFIEWVPFNEFDCLLELRGLIITQQFKHDPLRCVDSHTILL